MSDKVIMTLKLNEVTQFGGIEKDLTFQGYGDGGLCLERKWIHPTKKDYSQFTLSDLEFRLLSTFKEHLDNALGLYTIAEEFEDEEEEQE